MQQLEQQNSAMTFDEVSMERSKSFMKALQITFIPCLGCYCNWTDALVNSYGEILYANDELKNLRPQLYSAAEYCEKSYLHNEQKQMVLDNLKDYAVRAIVNAVDHLGTVAYKLSDLFEQQTLDISTVELKISCLNQQLLTCQTYTDKEGLKQQQLLAIYPRHHKHYVLPGPVTRKPESCTQKQSEAGQKPILVKPRPFGSGPPSSKTLSWHLASETNSAINGVPLSHASVGTGGPTYSATTSEDAEAAVSSTPSITRLQLANVGPDSSAVPHTIGVTQQGSPEISKTLSAFRSLDNPGRREIPRTPVRSKSVLSGLFGKHKSTKQRMSQRSQN